MRNRLFSRGYGHWIVLGMVGTCAVAAACGLDPSTQPAESTESGVSTVTPSEESRAAANTADIPTEPNLKVAFIGDTAAGRDFKRVLDLIKAEKAQFVMVQGDLTYGNTAGDWFKAIDNAINKDAPGSTATLTIPYFVSKGNHDVDWQTLGSGLKARLGQWDIAPTHNDPTAMNYAVGYKGLAMVMVSDRETSAPTRNEYVEQRLADDRHIWKICSWHKNQRNSNVGPKNDEMGWAIYDTCRKRGAIVAQGHSHTYSRSKTLTSSANQTIDPTCNNAFDLCVGPGKDFFFDSSLGGNDIRPLNAVASMPHFAATYAGDYGALFIEFNVDGDPRKARGYFKNVGGVIVDPPASSGKTSFTITSSN
jgi:hypothetical protein